MRELASSYSPIPSQGKQNDQQMLDTILIRSVQGRSGIRTVHPHAPLPLLTDSPSDFSLFSSRFVKNLPAETSLSLSETLSSFVFALEFEFEHVLCLDRSIERSVFCMLSSVSFNFSFLFFFQFFFWLARSEIIYRSEEAGLVVWSVPGTRKPGEPAATILKA